LIHAVFARSRFVDLTLSAAHLRVASAETGGPVESAKLFPTMCLMHLQNRWRVKIQKRVIGRILKQSTAQFLLERNMNIAITLQVPSLESIKISPGWFWGNLVGLCRSGSNSMEHRGNSAQSAGCDARHGHSDCGSRRNCPGAVSMTVREPLERSKVLTFLPGGFVPGFSRLGAIGISQQPLLFRKIGNQGTAIFGGADL
jgi:hypothetical protein